MAQLQKLMAKLQDREFRDRVGAWAKEVVELADTPYRGSAEGFRELKGNWGDSVRLIFCLDMGHPVDLFSEVLARIPPPHIITTEEIADVFVDYFVANGPAGDIDDIYNRFLDHVRFRLLAQRCSRMFDLCEISEIPGHDASVRDVFEALGIDRDPDFPDGKPEELKLWAGDAMKLRIVGTRSLSHRTAPLPSRPTARTEILLAELIGQVSEGAMEMLADELIPAVRSLIRSVILIWGKSERMGLRLPGIKSDNLWKHFPLVTGCAKVLFPPEGRKDTMARRLSNAVRLLSEADRQTAMAIKLALSIAAIEALLGQKKSELARLLSERVALLLEPKCSLRSKARTFVKKLYNYRSDTLHGTALDNDMRMAENARKLAAFCLYAVWFRDDFYHRLESRTDKPTDFFEELDNHYKEGLMIGLPPDLSTARQLWNAI